MAGSAVLRLGGCRGQGAWLAFGGSSHGQACRGAARSAPCTLPPTSALGPSKSAPLEATTRMHCMLEAPGWRPCSVAHLSGARHSAGEAAATFVLLGTMHLKVLVLDVGRELLLGCWAPLTFRFWSSM